MTNQQAKARTMMTTGPNPEAVTLPEGSENEPIDVWHLHPGDTTPPAGAWVLTDEGPIHVDGGLVHWGNGDFRPTALPERWHVRADGTVDAGE